MAAADVDYKKDQKDVEVHVKEVINHYKLTLTHRKSKGLELAVREIEKKTRALASDLKNEVRAGGVTRLPTKCLAIKVRKSPCGNGTNSFDLFELKIHKRCFNIYCSKEKFMQIVSGIHSEPGMIMEVDEIDA